MLGSFIPNPNALRQLAQAKATSQGLKEIAEAVRDAVREVFEAEGPHPYATGAYLDSIEVVEEEGDVKVVARDPKAVWIELGTGGDSPTPAFHAMVRALEARGLKVVKGEG